MLAVKKLSGVIIFLLIAAILSALLFFYGRGYRLDIEQKGFKPTGVLTIRSTPTNAKVFINGQEKGNTNLDIADLPPGEYNLRIEKDGYSVWQKRILVKKEEVNEVEAVLFPLAPNLTSLTSSGVTKALVTNDGKKIIFSVQAEGKEGIWALDLSRRELPIFGPQGLAKIISDSKETKYSLGQFQISPDNKSILIDVPGKTPSYFLLNTESENSDPNVLFAEEFKKTQEDWAKKTAQDTTLKIKNLGQRAVSEAAFLSNIIFSPNEEKFLGIDKNSVFKVFDSKPRPLPNAKEQIYILPKAQKYVWFSDSKHLIGVEENNIFIVDVDGENKTNIYSGAFDPQVIAPWTDGSKIAILANFNSKVSKLPNLYAIELR